MKKLYKNSDPTIMIKRTSPLLWLIILWLSASHNSSAQIELVKDINPTGSGIKGNRLVLFNNELYFTGRDDLTNSELWKSDGTADGTVLVKDLRNNGGSDPQNLLATENYLYFTARTVETSPDYFLVRSDGTEEGTVIILSNEGTPMEVSNLTVLGDKLFFTYEKQSDFDPSLYVLHDDQNTAIQLTFPSEFNDRFDELTVFNNKLYFRTRSSADGVGYELYESDGTAEGTKLVKDLFPGENNNGDPDEIRVVGNRMYFEAKNEDGKELWISDGTAAGTYQVKDINPEDDSNPHGFIGPSENKVFFEATGPDIGQELFLTDGTPEGTYLIKDIREGSFTSSPNDFILAGDNLFFTARTEETGREIWFSDGTPDGTNLIKDINPGTEGSIFQNQGWLYHNGKVYFSAENGTQGYELYASDGTTAGTQLIQDLNPGSADSRPRYMVLYKDDIYFFASGPEGDELRRYTPVNVALNTISGFVYEFNPDDTNDQSNRLEGVTVTNTFTSATTTTNANGEYEIEAEDGHQVRFTKDGYSSFLLLTNFDEDGTVYNIPLTAQASNITFNFDPNVLNENEPAGTVAGRFTSKDFDNLTYSLVSGEGDTDNGSFTINGQDQLVAQFSADFETKSTYSIRVRATNGVDNPAEEIFTINITDLNEISGFVYQFNPDDTNDTSQRLNGVTVTNTFTSATTTTNANGEYEIEAEDGNQVRFTKDGYISFVLLTNFDRDGTVYNIPLTAAQNVNITFNFDPNVLNENEPVETVAGRFTSKDFDNLTYSLVSGEGDADNGSFTINEQDQLIAQFSADFETKSTYSIRVRASNGNDNPAEEIFIISITDVNEPLSNIAINTTQITSAFNGGLLTTISVSDPEDKNDVVYSFVQGDNDNGLFFIDGDQVFALPGFSIDGREEIVLQIRATDEFGEGLSIEETFIIPVIELAALRLNVSPADGNFCTGEEIAFSVEVLNAVNTPVIEWIVNGQQVTPNDVDLQAGDQVEIRVTAIDAADQQQKTIYSGVIQVAINEAPPATITSFGFIITASEGASHDWYYQGELLPDTTQSIIAKEVGEYQVAVTTDQGCTSLSESLFMFVTGLDGESKIEVRAYPNPVSKTITIQFNRPLFQGKIQAHDVNGREVFNRVINEKSKFSVNVSHWKDGIYLFRIQTNYGTHHFKILKK